MPLNEDAKGSSEKRIAVLQRVFIAIFLIYAGRLFAMQIVEVDVHRERADSITHRNSVIPAERGEIFTREYSKPLIYNTDSFAVRLTPAEIPRDQIPQTIARLAELLEIPASQIEKKLPAGSYYLFQPVEIASNIPYQKITVLAEHSDTLSGISWKPKPVRDYSETESLSHVIGYVGDITRDELTTLYNKGYSHSDTIGKAGIERQYDELLRGKDGSETSVVDVRGRVTGEKASRKSPEPGKSLVLTIDRNIQTLAAKALGDRMGAVVVLRPSNGEVLAMVSYPWYNPSAFLSNDAGGEYQKLISDQRKPLLNRAIQSHYPPGSTFKIVMTTGVLSENAFSPDKTVDCPGEISYGDRLWHCH
ncbi:MAG: penicillin-binding protein 2, partial [Spirochaetaceae bacterium]|nr:penicillin-binding protein 2 [Spirochaetaceae bacterium]